MTRFRTNLELIWTPLVLLFLLGCSHFNPRDSFEPKADVWQGSEVHLRNWLDYTESLDLMSPRELKLEADRLRRTPHEVRSWDDELRWSLTQAVQHTKNHNFQKAYEQIQPFASKTYLPPELRSWLKLYGQQLYLAVQLERELGEERRQRAELEKKLKALSELELELSQRGRVGR